MDHEVGYSTYQRMNVRCTVLQGRCDRPKEHEWRGQAENDLGGECGERRLTDRLAYQSGDEGGASCKQFVYE